MARAKNAIAAEMYELYKTGLSCNAIGKRYGITGESVDSLLRTRGLKLRPGPRRRSRELYGKAVRYKGRRFTPDRDGYLRCTTGRGPGGKNVLLHRLVWETNHGPVPSGYRVTFKDSNRANCSIENIELIAIGDIQRLKGGGNNRYTKGLAKRSAAPKRCMQCRELMMPHADGARKEGPAAFAKRRFCDFWCSRLWLNGRPKGSRLARTNWRAITGAAVDRAQQARDAVRSGRARVK